MSPGVATPWPAAPPIPIAKVRFMTPSFLSERPPIHYAQRLVQAQMNVCIPVRETPHPPLRETSHAPLALPVAGVYTQSLRRHYACPEPGRRGAHWLCSPIPSGRGILLTPAQTPGQPRFMRCDD